VAGTLKLDQAQYRELEAFAKFGSDLDQATKNVLEKGKRNVEILKQPQYAPLTVEEQIAILFCGVKGLLLKVPVSRIRDFETDFLHTLHVDHPETLDLLKKGIIDDGITQKLERVCKEVALKYEN
jgi:F-type H+-transporting ATPase subunit alpha